MVNLVSQLLLGISLEVILFLNLYQTLSITFLGDMIVFGSFFHYFRNIGVGVAYLQPIPYRKKYTYVSFSVSYGIDVTGFYTLPNVVKLWFLPYFISLINKASIPYLRIHFSYPHLLWPVSSNPLSMPIFSHYHPTLDLAPCPKVYSMTLFFGSWLHVGQ